MEEFIAALTESMTTAGFEVERTPYNAVKVNGCAFNVYVNYRNVITLSCRGTYMRARLRRYKAGYRISDAVMYIVTHMPRLLKYVEVDRNLEYWRERSKELTAICDNKLFTAYPQNEGTGMTLTFQVSELHIAAMMVDFFKDLHGEGG